MLELADKNITTAITFIFHIFRKLSGATKVIKIPNQISRNENYHVLHENYMS